MGGTRSGQRSWGAVADGTPFSSQTAQKNYGDAPGVLSSESCLEGEEPGPLSQQLQATSSSSSEPLSNLDLSHESLAGLQYLPFFRTYEHLLSEEELALQPEVCRDQRGDWGIRGVPFQEDLEPPSGFFPYYHSEEESFPSLLCGGSQDPPTRTEVQAGYFCRRTVSSRSSVSGDGHTQRPWKGAGSSPGPHCLLQTSVLGTQTPVGQTSPPPPWGSAGAPGVAVCPC